VEPPLKSIVQILVVTFTVSPGFVNAEPIDSLRLSYVGHQAPDHLIYSSLIRMMSAYSAERDRDDAIGTVFAGINAIQNQEGAWLMPPTAESLRHSKREAELFLDYMLDAKLTLDGLNIEATRRFACRRYRSESAFYQALDELDDEYDRNSNACYEKSQRDHDATMNGSIRSWLDRSKDGYRKRYYNHAKLYEGASDMHWKVRQQEMCELAGGSVLP
jgi:hypothetical protein